MFSKVFSAWLLKLGIVCRINSVPNDKISNWSRLKAFADDKINVTKNLKFALGREESIVGKGKKCWLPAFSPLPTMLSKGLFHGGVKSQDCVVKD